MLRDDTGQGVAGDVLVALKTLRAPTESRSVEVMPRVDGRVRVVVRHLMDGWSLWETSAWPVVGDTVLRQLRRSTSREGLFDAA